MTEVTSSAAIDEAGRLRAGSAASWGAITAGAVVAISVSLILMTLGAGLGFASVSPWTGRGASASGFMVAGTIWLIVTQWLSAGIGGYLAGRLRQRWLATHTHEVFFRDTAHGLITWSLATLAVAAVLVGSAASVVEGGAHAVGGMVGAGAHGAGLMGEIPHDRNMRPEGGEGAGSNGAYDLDKLFRNPSPSNGGTEPHGNEGKMEAAHLAANAAANGNLGAEDRTYLANLVAARTGVTPEEAQKRVDAFIQSVQDSANKAKAAADEARKAAATAALYTALALLIGAFIASVAAVIGGRLRDEHL
jgi:hypothetical protein